MGDILRLFCLMRAPPQVYHWRSHSGAEVDLRLERDGIFWPIEIKAAARVTTSAARGIHAFRATYPHLRNGAGCIVAAVDETSRLSEDVFIVPYVLP